MGPVRSLRLPRALDAWFEQRLCAEPSASASQLLLRMLHGGLRLKPGYMVRHRRALEGFVARADAPAYLLYRKALEETFGETYVEHLERWLETDGIAPLRREGYGRTTRPPA
jgi:hypothetical protein